MRQPGPTLAKASGVVGLSSCPWPCTPTLLSTLLGVSTPTVLPTATTDNISATLQDLMTCCMLNASNDCTMQASGGVTM